jgi:hypothetical protein
MSRARRAATSHEVGELVRAVRTRLDFLHELVPESGGLPARWCPSEVYDPRRKRKQVFVAKEAWRFVLETLERGQPVEWMELDRPPDGVGWVLKVPSVHRPEPIYIKLQLDTRGYVIGRSFHYSDPR